MAKHVRWAVVIAVCLSFAGWAGAQDKSFNILNPEVKQGGTIVIKIDKNFLDGRTALKAFDKVYWPDADGLVFVGVDLATMPDTYTVYLWNYAEEERADQYYEKIKITDGEFSERPWPFKLSKPNKSDRPKIETKKRREEKILINNALDYLARDPEENYLSGKFCAPLERMEIVEDFGTKRVSRGAVIEQHGGVDLRTNDPHDPRDRKPKQIAAINSGKVLLARRLSMEGNLVIIYHGQGIYSLYMHMSRLKVKVNQIVKGGQVIGLSGNTGHITGPHLDFRVKINGSYVDPIRFIGIMNRYF